MQHESKCLIHEVNPVQRHATTHRAQRGMNGTGIDFSRGSLCAGSTDSTPFFGFSIIQLLKNVNILIVCHEDVNDLKSKILQVHWP